MLGRPQGEYSVSSGRIGGLGISLMCCACVGGSESTELSDADNVRLEAVLEATSSASSAPICLAVDPGVTSEVYVIASAPSEDASGSFLRAVSRLGRIYPISRCPETGVHVTLVAVSVMSERGRAPSRAYFARATHR